MKFQTEKFFFIKSSFFIFQERTFFVWGFDRATSLDDLIEFFETEFPNVVNLRQRTAINEDNDEKVFLQIHGIFVLKIKLIYYYYKSPKFNFSSQNLNSMRRKS